MHGCTFNIYFVFVAFKQKFALKPRNILCDSGPCYFVLTSIILAIMDLRIPNVADPITFPFPLHAVWLTHLARSCPTISKILSSSLNLKRHLNVLRIKLTLSDTLFGFFISGNDEFSQMAQLPVAICLVSGSLYKDFPTVLALAV